MKIGLITIVKVNNYGAELQATATQKFLELMGYETEIIDYCYYKTWNFKDTKMSEPFVPMGMKDRLVYWVKYRVIAFLVACVFPLINKKVAVRSMRFAQFHRDNTKMSRQYMSMDELYGAKMDYDVYMVGSDQVWNPAASSSIEPYFLTFAPKGAKKVTYASSFGVSRIISELEKQYAELLTNIDSISVREQTGVELVKKLTGKKAELVLDPTLLLTKEQWKPMMKQYPGISRRYILIYQLLPSADLPALALKLSKENSCVVYYLTKRAYGIKVSKGIKAIYDAGPAEFLSLIENAVCVVTNSFHGVAFSINFNTPFYAVLNPNRESNARIESLLDQIGVNDRIIYEGEDYMHKEVYWGRKEDVDEKLIALKQKSINYLNSSLKNDVSRNSSC